MRKTALQFPKKTSTGSAKYFQKILLYLMIAVILSVLLLSVVLYSVSLGFLKKEITSHNNTILNYISFSIDKSLSSVKRDALMAADVFNVDSQNMISLRNVSKRIGSVLYNNNFVDEVFVHYRDTDTIIGYEGLYSFDNFFPKKFCIEQEQIEPFKTALKEKNNFSVRRFDAEGESYVCIMQSFPIYSEVSDGVIVFCINSSRFSEALNAMIQSNRTIVGETYSLGVYSKESGLLYTSNEGTICDDDVVSHIESGIFSDISYVVSSTTNHLQAQRRLIFISVVAAGMVLIGIGLVFSYIASKQLYRPVQEVVQNLLQLPDSGSPLFSDDFEFINQKISDLSLVTEDLRDNFESNRKLVEKMLVRNLFTGSASEEENEQLLREMCHPVFAIVTVYFYSPVREGALLSDEEIGRCVEEDSQKYFAHEGEMICRTSRNSVHSISMLLNFEDVTRFQECLRGFGKACLELGGRGRCNFVLGLSDFFRDPVDIVTAYDNSISALKNAPINTKLFIAHYDAEISNQELVQYTEKEKTLVNRAVLGDSKTVEQTLDEIFSENINERSTFHSTYRLYLRLISSLEEVIHQSRMEDASKARYIRTLQELLEAGTMNNSEDYCTRLKTIFLEISDYQSAQSSEDPVIHQILEYIGENYASDISLEDVSSKFHLNYKYVSRYFKQQQGITFSAYLSRLRIQKAKQLIAQDANIKIKDLAQQVGFLNTNTFITLFKKYEGVTPGQYVELYRSRNAD